MAEDRVEIPARDIVLEGCFEDGPRSEGVVVCHPHPLYGGSMDNNVVFAVCNAFRSWGAGVLRFNFRGVGRSGGEYSQGEGETEDVLAAASWLSQRGRTALHLAGYSYGAWVALKAIRKGLKPVSMMLVSPPVDFLDFDDLRLPDVPCLITVGDRDSFCAVESLKNWLAGPISEGSAVDFEIFPENDHFYGGRESVLTRTIVRFLHRHFTTGIA